MKKKATFVFCLIAFLLVTVFMFFQKDVTYEEPDAYQSLAHEEGETRTNGPGEFLLPVRSELK